MPLATAPPSPIALLRFVAGLSQTELAERAGLSRETISRLERGEVPRLTTARRLANALGVDIASIFPHNEEGAPSANGTPSQLATAGAGPNASQRD